jgi:hypothetical protein
MLSAFGDESADSAKSKLFAVGGLLGDSEQWAKLREKWKVLIGGTVFHAADCESGHGDYKGVPEDERWALHRRLTETLAASCVFGWGRSIDLEGCRSSFPNALKETPDLPYYDCFLFTVIKLCDLAVHFVPPERVEFTFDQHKQTQYNAGLLYDWLINHRPQAADKVSYSTRKELGVQAADLWARELMKRCDGILYNPRSFPRDQWRILKATGRFSGEFLREGYWRRLLTQDQDLMVQAGFNMAAFELWRKERKVVDNASNRFLYVSSLDAGNLRNVKHEPGDIIEL